MPNPGTLATDPPERLRLPAAAVAGLAGGPGGTRRESRGRCGTRRRAIIPAPAAMFETCVRGAPPGGDVSKGDIHTVKHGDGWANRAEGHERVSNTAPTKA